jgi:hypothetical protein
MNKKSVNPDKLIFPIHGDNNILNENENLQARVKEDS